MLLSHIFGLSGRLQHSLPHILGCIVVVLKMYVRDGLRSNEFEMGTGSGRNTKSWLVLLNPALLNKSGLG